MRPDCFKNQHCNVSFLPWLWTRLYWQGQSYHSLTQAQWCNYDYSPSLFANAGGFSSSSTRLHFISLCGLDSDMVHVGMWTTHQEMEVRLFSHVVHVLKRGKTMLYQSPLCGLSIWWHCHRCVLIWPIFALNYVRACRVQFHAVKWIKLGAAKSVDPTL